MDVFDLVLAEHTKILSEQAKTSRDHKEKRRFKGVDTNSLV